MITAYGAGTIAVRGAMTVTGRQTSASRRIKNAIKYQPLTRPVYLAARRLQVDEWSPVDNVYHCCTQKTASQWFRAVLRDPIVHRHTGWDVIPYRELGLNEARIEGRFPRHTVAAHLYVDYSTYDQIPKPETYRTFFILRDPRDCVVSWYFSMRYSHNPEFGIVQELRAELQEIDDDVKGIKHMIRRTAEFGFFDAQRSWVRAPASDSVKILLYEDFAQDNMRFLRDLLGFLEVRVNEADFAQLAERHSFRQRAGGRSAGESDAHSHYRKGVSGDWVNYFDADLVSYFESVAGDIVAELGYS
jgi:hypothetical protein